MAQGDSLVKTKRPAKIWRVYVSQQRKKYALLKNRKSKKKILLDSEMNWICKVNLFVEAEWPSKTLKEGFSQRLKQPWNLVVFFVCLKLWHTVYFYANSNEILVTYWWCQILCLVHLTEKRRPSNIKEKIQKIVDVKVQQSFL